MTESASRRNFLKAASLGAAAVGATATAAPAVARRPVPDRPVEAAGPAHSGALTAYIRDHRTGEIAVMAGEHEVICHDRELAHRLARIAARAQES